MKTNLPSAAPILASLALFLALTAPLAAAPLAGTTAVHNKPDDASPAIASLKAGTEPVAATSAPQNLPAGWMAVEVPGPFQIYVQSKDLTKTLDPKPGVPAFLNPRPEGAVLTTIEAGDKLEMTGTLGRWMQFTLAKSVVGYIQVGGQSPAASPLSPAPVSNANAPIVSPAPLVTPAPANNAPGQAVPIITPADGSLSSLPRQFAGKFLSTRRPFAPRRPYDWALHDDTGKRYAYLDVSKLLLTEQIEKYVNHTVAVSGTARIPAGSQDLVITVETLQLK